MHQPDYRTPDGDFMLPWVYLHALKDYIDMPLNIMSVSGMKANVNITPVLIDQWQDYNLKIEQALSESDRNKSIELLPNRFLKPLLMDSFDVGWRRWMAKHYRQSNPERMIARFEHYQSLVNISSQNFSFKYLNNSFYSDLAVWFHLAWCGEWMKKHDDFIKFLIKKETAYTQEEKRSFLKRILKWLKYGLSLYGQPEVKGANLPLWPPEFPYLIEKETYRKLLSKNKGEYTVTLTPYCHPILPLLIDIHSGDISAQISQVEYEPLDVDEYPEGFKSAKKHIERLKYYWWEENWGEAYNNNLRNPFSLVKAIWPAEGAISEKTLDMFSDEGIEVCASGEELLAMSMGANVHEFVSFKGCAVMPLYRVFRWKETPLRIIFRDSGLSDLIGFTYSKWRGDDAANDLVNKLHSIDDFDKDACVAIILDGENAWEHYYENGFYFLRDLYSLISSSSKINPLSVKDIAVTENCINLDNIYPGSWVYGNLAMWIGEKQKNAAWILLVNAKKMYIKWVKIADNDEKILKVEEQMLKCEASDWFWWLGPNNPLYIQSQIEKVFRKHLKNLYIMMGIEPPSALDNSLATSDLTFAELGGAMKRGRKS